MRATDPDPVPEPVFVAWMRVGGRSADASHYLTAAEPLWGAELKGALTSLLRGDEDIRQLVQESPGKSEQYILVRVDADSGMGNAVEVDALRGKLKSAVFTVLSPQDDQFAFETARPISDRVGHVFLTVLLLASQDAVVAYFQRVKNNEEPLAVRRENKQQPPNPVELLAAEFADLVAEPAPAEFEAAAAESRRLLTLAKEIAAARLAPALNQCVAATPHETLDDKQTIVAWVNALLRELGLAIRDSKTSLPGILVADEKGAKGTQSRFRVQVQEGGSLKRRSLSSRDPSFELMPDVPRAEPLASAAWTERVGRRGQDSPRKGTGGR